MNRLEFRTWNDYPEECYNIEPGCAIVFLPVNADRYCEARNTCMSFEKFTGMYNFGFRLNIRFVETGDPRLINRIVARRINFGNLDSYSVITADLSNGNIVHSFLNEYFNLTSPDAEKIKFVKFDHTLDGRDFQGRIRLAQGDVRPVDNQDNEDVFIRHLELQKMQILDNISRLISNYVSQTHSLPSSAEIQRLIGGLIHIGDSGPSKIHVDNNLQIWLPDYDNINFPFSALQKTLYFLFLRHPEGIALADMNTYRGELESIYNLVMPNREEELARVTLDRLTDTYDNESLRQQLSKIKRIVKAKITNDSIAEKYYITGQRGCPYSIHVGSDMITLPRALSGQL